MQADKPAIAGGKPAKTRAYAKQPRYGEEELSELKEAIAQGTLFYAGGKKVKSLEKAFAEKHGAKFGIAASSGTAAIHAATMAAGICCSTLISVNLKYTFGVSVKIAIVDSMP